MNNTPIRFQGWHVSQQKMFTVAEMVRDQMALLPDGRFANIHGGDTSKSIIYPTDKFIPLLSTGRSDKYGEEIFCGDIVTVDGRSTVHLIEWGDVGFVMTPEYEARSFFELWERSRLRKVGNIYQNPELLP